MAQSDYILKCLLFSPSGLNLPTHFFVCLFVLFEQATGITEHGIL